MKKYFSLIILLTFFFACGNKSAHPSGEKLSKEKMVDVLIDVHLAEASEDPQLLNKKEGRDTMQIEYQKIFAKHKIDGEDFYSTYNYYLEHPALLDSVYDELVTRVSTLQSNFLKQNSAIANTDTFAVKDSLKAQLLRQAKSHKHPF